MKKMSWNLSPKAAVAWQRLNADRVETRPRLEKVKVIAGVDVAFTRDKKRAICGIILFAYPGLAEIERVYATAPLNFPYVPGLLTFREGPVIEKAFRKLRHRPQLICFDGQGRAHPRRMGLASHMGLVLDRPAIGCAKSRLCGQAEEPLPQRGSWTPLLDGGETVGAVLRTRDGVKPIYVSVGHRVDLRTAIRWTLACHDGTRIPKPTREADRFVSQLKKRLR